MEQSVMWWQYLPPALWTAIGWSVVVVVVALSLCFVLSFITNDRSKGEKEAR